LRLRVLAEFLGEGAQVGLDGRRRRKEELAQDPKQRVLDEALLCNHEARACSRGFELPRPRASERLVVVVDADHLATGRLLARDLERNPPVLADLDEAHAAPRNRLHLDTCDVAPPPRGPADVGDERPDPIRWGLQVDRHPRHVIARQCASDGDEDER